MGVVRVHSIVKQEEGLIMTKRSGGVRACWPSVASYLTNENLVVLRQIFLRGQKHVGVRRRRHAVRVERVDDLQAERDDRRLGRRRPAIGLLAHARLGLGLRDGLGLGLGGESAAVPELRACCDPRGAAWLWMMKRCAHADWACGNQEKVRNGCFGLPDVCSKIEFPPESVGRCRLERSSFCQYLVV